jgi:hypothetical protein
MNPVALDRAVLSSRLTPFSQLMGTYDSKTDQTAQTDQTIEHTSKIGASPGPELTSRPPKLTSGTAQQPAPGVQVDVPAHSTHPCANDGAPRP